MISKSSGQSLIDILIGSALIVLVIGFSIILIFGGQQILIDRDSATQAINLAQAGIQGASIIIHKNWNSSADGNYGLSFSRRGVWNFSGNQDQQVGFTRVVNVRSTGIDQKEVKSTVSWTGSGGRSLNIELISVITNWANVIATGGDTGGTGIDGNWQSPQSAGTVDLGSGVSATDLDVKNKIVFMTGEASDHKKNDFFVIDATDSNNPLIRSKINVGSGGLNALDVAGSYAYVANQEDEDQFMVIDVSVPSTSTIKSTLDLPNNNKEALSIFYRLGKVYIGTEKNSSGPEFYVIDVSSSSNPQVAGTKEINADVNAINVTENNSAYLATEDDSKELVILDVTTASSTTELGSFNASGDEDGKSLYIVGTTLYLGRTSGSNEFIVLDVANPVSIQQLSSVDLSGTSVNDLVARDNLLFMATSDANKELQIRNVSVSTSTTLWGFLNFPQDARGIDYEDNFVYAALRSNDSLRIITSAP